jgi:hypothetical protein
MNWSGWGLMIGKKEVCWWVELAIRPGCLNDFEKLTDEMVTSTRAENGVLAYQRFVSDDRQGEPLVSTERNAGADRSVAGHAAGVGHEHARLAGDVGARYQECFA